MVRDMYLIRSHLHRNIAEIPLQLLSNIFFCCISSIEREKVLFTDQCLIDATFGFTCNNILRKLAGKWGREKSLSGVSSTSNLILLPPTNFEYYSAIDCIGEGSRTATLTIRIWPMAVVKSEKRFLTKTSPVNLRLSVYTNSHRHKVMNTE